VTSAYKKKMAEMEKLEEEERRKEALEGDFSCSSFHIYYPENIYMCV